MNAADNARVCGSLQWVTGRLFELIGGWVARVDDPADAVWLATLSRHLGHHVAAFDDVMPDSVLLSDERAVSPADAVVEPTLAALADTADPVGTAGALVVQLTAECGEILENCAPHADGSLRRVVEFLMIDLASVEANRLRPVAKVAETFRMVTPVV